MKTRRCRNFSLFLVLAFTTQGILSCATMKEHPIIAGIGIASAVGAGSYFACKAAGGSDPECAAIAALAAVAAGSVTYIALHKLADRDAVVKDRRYQPPQGKVALIDSITVTPSPSAPGAELALESQWLVLGPDPNEQFPYREKWEIRKEGGNTSHTLNDYSGTTGQGRYRSGIKFPMPKNLPPGAYQATYSLAVADKQLSTSKRFDVVEHQVGDGRVTHDVVL